MVNFLKVINQIKTRLRRRQFPLQLAIGSSFTGVVTGESASINWNDADGRTFEPPGR